MKKISTKPTKDDVARLSRGRPTKSRVGSRAIRHRLNQDELKMLAVAKKVGYLKIPVRRVRQALINTYLMWCEATGIDPIIKEHKDVK